MDLKDKLRTLPKKPGCYLHKDKDGNVIYVGKAINLFNRVNSYFIGAHDYKTTKLVSNIRDFDYIVTKSEKEALILEYNLIKEYDPKFNIVFKDDKTYPYILIKDTPEPYCSVIRINKKSRYKGKIYGPYPDVGASRNLVDLINKLWPTRKCDPIKKELCLYYHLKQCPGYCVNQVDQKENDRIKEEIASFISGDVSGVVKRLKEDMNKAVEILDYEKAAYYRDLINDINTTILKQNVQSNTIKETFDVFNYAVKDGYFALTGLFIKKGRLLSTDKYLDYLVGDIENVVSSYIYQFYEINQKPKVLYVPSELLPFLKDGIEGVEIKSVTRGYKLALLKQAKENSEENLRQNFSTIASKELYYEEIANEFYNIFKTEIKRIEIFDNSHTGGVNTVAGMVVYENFKPNKKEYRLYKLEDSADDLNSMKEVLYRRYFRVLKDNLKRPDLIIVDGAKTQIDIAKEVLSSLDMHIPIVGLGKDDHHNTSYMMDENLNIIDIAKDSRMFFFLTNMQDEVHRFAITYHKKLRSKSTYKSLLDDIKGLGPRTRTKLMRKYKSISNLKTQSLEELQTVLNKNVALELYNKLKENSNA